MVNNLLTFRSVEPLSALNMSVKRCKLHINAICRFKDTYKKRDEMQIQFKKLTASLHSWTENSKSWVMRLSLITWLREMKSPVYSSTVTKSSIKIRKSRLAPPVRSSYFSDIFEISKSFPPEITDIYKIRKPLLFYCLECISYMIKIILLFFSRFYILKLM